MRLKFHLKPHLDLNEWMGCSLDLETDVMYKAREKDHGWGL